MLVDTNSKQLKLEVPPTPSEQIMSEFQDKTVQFLQTKSFLATEQNNITACTRCYVI